MTVIEQLTSRNCGKDVTIW